MVKDNSKDSDQKWKKLAKGVKNQIEADHIGITSAGVAFYFFLALFPAVAALVSLYGLVNDPSQVERQMAQLTAALPAEAHRMITERLKGLVQTSDQTLGWGVALSFLLSLWSANRGTKALFEGVNIAYNQKKKRNFFQENGLTLLFTIGGMVAGIIAMGLVIGFPVLLGKLGLPETIQTIISWGRWLILAVVVILGLGLVYHFAPDRNNTHFRLITEGAVVSTVLWMIGSWAFSFYVNNFGNYNEAYGSVAAAIILMLWFYLTSFIILFGAEINSELERHKRETPANTVEKAEPQFSHSS